jgi:hypothetical protein
VAVFLVARILLGVLPAFLALGWFLQFPRLTADPPAPTATTDVALLVLIALLARSWARSRQSTGTFQGALVRLGIAGFCLAQSPLLTLWIGIPLLFALPAGFPARPDSVPASRRLAVIGFAAAMVGLAFLVQSSFAVIPGLDHRPAGVEPFERTFPWPTVEGEPIWRSTLRDDAWPAHGPFLFLVLLGGCCALLRTVQQLRGREVPLPLLPLVVSPLLVAHLGLLMSIDGFDGRSVALTGLLVLLATYGLIDPIYRIGERLVLRPPEEATPIRLVSLPRRDETVERPR